MRPLNIDEDALSTYNKIHIGFCVQVERGIGGLEHKFWKLMKWYKALKVKYDHLFWATTLMTNYLHHRHMDFANEVIGAHIINENEHGWEKYY